MTKGQIKELTEEEKRVKNLERLENEIAIRDQFLKDSSMTSAFRCFRNEKRLADEKQAQREADKQKMIAANKVKEEVSRSDASVEENTEVIDQESNDESEVDLVATNGEGEE